MQKTRGYNIRAARIRELTELHYEPGRQDRCLKTVWRRHIYPVYGISYHAYLRYIRYLTHTQHYDRDRQLSLFD